MAVRKQNPTSAGQRFVVRVVHEGLHKGEPHTPLLARLKKNGGRNNAGRITTRHQGGGHKRHYRIIDFKRNKDGIVGRIERLEYDPNRSAHLALVQEYAQRMGALRESLPPPQRFALKRLEGLERLVALRAS